MAEVRERFSSQIAALKEHAEPALAGLGVQGAVPRWYSPNKGNWSGSVFDIPGIAKAYDRDDNASDYREALVRDGSSGDMTGSQLQGDYLAIQQRAYIMRHSTVCRSAVHAAGRRFGQSAPGGVFEYGVRSYVENVIRAGKE